MRARQNNLTACLTRRKFGLSKYRRSPFGQFRRARIRAMVDSNNSNNAENKGSTVDKPGTYSDNLVKLIEETDKDGNICYCVECATTGDLLYSCNSKPQAFSFAEGYRARDNSEPPKTPKPKPKEDDNNPPEDKSKPTQVIDPVKARRKRVAI
jgi:hypothetical protein